MSRFIQYASNLLDGVDNIAKGSLTDQDIAAAAAERRRRRKQAKLQERQSQGLGPGDLSEGLSESDYGEGMHSMAANRRRGREAAGLMGVEDMRGEARDTTAVGAGVAAGEAAAHAAATTTAATERGDGVSGFSGAGGVTAGEGHDQAAGASPTPATATHGGASETQRSVSATPGGPSAGSADGAEGPQGTAALSSAQDDDTRVQSRHEQATASTAPAAPSSPPGGGRIPGQSPQPKPLTSPRTPMSIPGKAATGTPTRHPLSGSPPDQLPVEPSGASGRAGEGDRKGLRTLLGRGITGRGGPGKGGQDVEALKAEASALRAEVEELCLELEDAEDRLKGQEAELISAADALRRQKAAALERESVMAAEMENFRALQAEEKKVFLANLEAVEKTVKERSWEAEEAKLALSALEALAVERDDVATRLTREKEEVIEELRGARSVQDRSAEELKEALTRAEREAEETDARHRAWMRQAQARQTELEGTAAQLAEALAEANRKLSGGGEEGSQRSAQLVLDARRAHASARELRIAQEELESCQASLELEQERTRALEQELKGLRQDLAAARAAEAVAERQSREHGNMAADALAKVARLEKQLEQEKANGQRLGAPPRPADTETQIQALSRKLLDKQARLDESVCERATLSAKLQQVTERAVRAEQELREARGESLEAGTGEGGGLRRRTERLGMGRVAHAGSWSRLPPIAKHKKIATAVDALDRATLQVVVLVRNSPGARAAFVGYLVLLHLWTFVILGLRSHSSTMATTPSLPGNSNGTA